MVARSSNYLWQNLLGFELTGFFIHRLVTLGPDQIVQFELMGFYFALTVPLVHLMVMSTVQLALVLRLVLLHQTLLSQC